MILVVGGTGFVGAGIVRELARRGKPLAVLSRNPERHRDRFPGLNVELRRGDVTDPSSLPPALVGVEAVIACQQFPNSPIENPRKGHTFEKVDAEGTENLVRAAKEAGVRRFVYISGVGAAPDGRYHWFRAKWRAETAVRDSGITYTIIRPSWVFGPGDVALNRFLAISRFLPFVPLIGNPAKQRLQPVFIDDVARAVAESLENPAADNKTFEIGGPEALTMAQIVRAAMEVAGRRRFFLAVPKPVMKLLASVLQFAPDRPLTPDAVDFITMDALADPAGIEAALGIKMTPLREALATYLGRSAK